MRFNRVLLSIIIILVVLILDQSLKIWVKTHMLLYEDSYLHWDWWKWSWFRLKFVENEGMAFGIILPGKYGKLALSLIRIVFIVIIVIVLYKNIYNYRLSFTIFLSLVVAGAMGNLIDSMFYGLIFTDSPFYGLGAEPAKFVPFGQGYGKFLYGRVVDMLYFPICVCKLPDWLPGRLAGQQFEFFAPIFNLADSAIFVGTLGLLLFNHKLKENEQV